MNRIPPAGLPSVHLIDGNERTRAQTSTVLGDAGFRVKAFEDLNAFLNASTHVLQGCILLENDSPSTTGWAMQTRLHHHGVQAPVLFLTAATDAATAVEVMRRGAVDLIQRPIEPAALVERVAYAMAVSLARSGGRIDRAAVLELFRNLSPREQEVFARLATGSANKQIAIEFQISQRTVEVHRARLMMKMNATSFADLVRLYAACEHAEVDNALRMV